ncbi:hypothetical protein P3T42_002259 [Paraburkholderia sp. GAS38]
MATQFDELLAMDGAGHTTRLVRRHRRFQRHAGNVRACFMQT